MLRRHGDKQMRSCVQAAPKPALRSKSLPSPDLGSAQERVKFPRRDTSIR